MLDIADYLTNDFSSDVELLYDERKRMLEDSDKIIPILEDLLIRFKSLRLKTMTEDNKVLNAPLKPIPKSLINCMVMFLHHIVHDCENDKDCKQGVQTLDSMKETVINVNDCNSMEVILEIIDRLILQK